MAAGRLDYKKFGRRETLKAVMVVNNRNFPHVLLLQETNEKGEAIPRYSLPGGVKKPGESDRAGMSRVLNSVCRRRRGSPSHRHPTRISSLRSPLPCSFVQSRCQRRPGTGTIP
jgi:hypothetical protein